MHNVTPYSAKNIFRSAHGQLSLRRVLTATLLFAVAAPVDAANDCVRFSELSQEDLARFDFSPGALAHVVVPEDTVYVIDDITVVRQPIFPEVDDEEEHDHWLYRAANVLHSNTRESTVRSALLFEHGDRVPGRVLAESERELRAREFLYDARVIPRIACNARLGVDVVVRDVWTLLPDLYFERSGGVNEYTVGFTESNVLGTGKTLSVRYQSDIDRDSASILYEDPNLFGTRMTLGLEAATTDDGSIARFEVEQPFYSLEAPFSTGVQAGRERLDEGLFFRSEEFASFSVDRRTAGAFVGTSGGTRNGITLRWLAGVQHESHRFARPAVRESPALVPADRRRTYPWVGVERIRAEYLREANVDHIYRTEDVFVGTALTARIGYAAGRFGTDGNRMPFNGEFSGGRLLARDAGGELSDRHVLSYDVELEGEWAIAADRIEQLLVQGEIRYRYRQTDHFSVSATAALSASRRLPDDRQLLLGGDTGLRGYPNRYQVGDRAWRVTVEQRYFSPAYPLRLFRVGGALFMDVGRAWFPGDPDDNGFGMLANVGAGLRLDPTRAWRDRVVHLDVARSLRDGPGVNRWEVTLTARQTL